MRFPEEGLSERGRETTRSEAKRKKSPTSDILLDGLRADDDILEPRVVAVIKILEMSLLRIRIIFNPAIQCVPGLEDLL